jgi:hypothetical protein
MNIRQIAGMLALGGQEAVLFLGRIEVSTRRFERRLATADLMNMNGVCAGRNSLGISPNVNPDQHPVGGLRYGRVANLLLFRIDKFGFNGLARC